MANIMCKKVGFNDYLVYLEIESGSYKPLDSISYFKKKELEKRVEGLSNNDVRCFVKIYRKKLLAKLGGR